MPLGEVLYKKGDPHPPMPRHPNCRCVFRAKTVSFRELGIDLDELDPIVQPVVTRGYEKNGKWIIPPVGTGTGHRPRAISFHQGGMKEAFPDLPAAQQKAMLGVGRYNLYKAGDLTLDQLVDPVSGKMWLLKEIEQGMHLKSVAQSNVYTIKGLTKLISEQDESKFDRELIRTKTRYEKHLKQSELYKYGLIRRETGSGIFSILQKNGIDLSKLEEEIEEAGLRGVFSRTAGINQVFLDVDTALEIGQKNAYKKMIAELKREGYIIK